MNVALSAIGFLTESKKFFLYGIVNLTGYDLYQFSPTMGEESLFSHQAGRSDSGARNKTYETWLKLT